MASFVSRSTFAPVSTNECIAPVLGMSLGLSKDTTARAIRRLRDDGLVTAAQQRTTVGVFDTGIYRIAIPEQIALVTSAPTAPHPNRRVARTDLSQLSFAIESRGPTPMTSPSRHRLANRQVPVGGV
jgi:hypothetical protein